MTGNHNFSSKNSSSSTATAVTTTSTTTTSTNFREIYEVTGDSAAALKALMEASATSSSSSSSSSSSLASPSLPPTPTSSSSLSLEAKYNRHILQSLAGIPTSTSSTIAALKDDASVSKFLNELDQLASPITSSSSSNSVHTTSSATGTTTMTKKQRRDHWIVTYNRGLLLLTMGKTRECMELMSQALRPILVSSMDDENGTSAATATTTPTTGKRGKHSSSSSNKHQQQYLQNQHSSKKIILNKPSPLLSTKELNSIACRMAFLFLEAILVAAAVPRPCPSSLTVSPPTPTPTTPLTSPSSHSTHVKEQISSPAASFPLDYETVLSWLTNCVMNNDEQVDFDPTLKFQFSLYKGRLDFIQRHNEKLVDARIRSARKELKHAMEIFQHKLRPMVVGTSTNATTGDTASLASSRSGGAMSITNGNDVVVDHTAEVSQTTTTVTGNPSSSSNNSHNNNNSSATPALASDQLGRVLQAQNQAALNLKANTEQLKGNVKKSLILLAEAAGTNDDATVTSNDASSSNIITNPNTLTSSTQQLYYKSLHYNNLGIVYNTSGKRHLALHAWSKALSTTTTPTSDGTDKNKNNNSITSNPTTTSIPLLESDGTANLNMQLRIHHNAALGAMQTQNYLAAYQCMATCLVGQQKQTSLSTSPPPTLGPLSSLQKKHQDHHHLLWEDRPRCWLRLAEACIGISAKIKKENRNARFSKIEVKGEPRGILLRSSNDKTFDSTGLEYALGSKEDLEYIQTDPLSRARVSLEIAISLFEKENNKIAEKKKNNDYHYYPSHHQMNGGQPDSMGLSQAHLSLAFVCLEQNDFEKALGHANWVLSNVSIGNNNNNNSNKNKNKKMDSIRASLIKRQLATARMYASEASCALGQTVQSMRHLVGDGKDDAFDRLASDLAGVTIGTAAAHPYGKARLAKAQAMVRCSASVASAELGNLPAAKQLAMSAQAMEDASAYSSSYYDYLANNNNNTSSSSSTGSGNSGGGSSSGSVPSRSSREASLARRALVYSNLREGNSGGAFTLMRSSR